MVRVSVLNDALKTMYNAEKRGKRQVLLRPSSKVVIKFLQVMMRHGESLPSCSPSPVTHIRCCCWALCWQLCSPWTASAADTGSELNANSCSVAHPR